MKEGICKVRRNVNKVLYSLNYGVVTAINIDPIEKKPLYHFWPGSKILSIGTKGCNFKCIFCQNHHISQRDIQDNDFVDNYHPEQIIDIALRQKNNIGIAYTYNEPIIWYEFVLDTAKLANKKGLKNVMVTNGFINQKPLKDLLKYIDAFNIDLKFFDDYAYNKYTGGKLINVLETIKTVKSSGKHFEITHLIVTDLNDNIEQFSKMVNWIANNVGINTPLHISRYFPSYKYSASPTDLRIIDDFYNIAKNKLNFVYKGNVIGNGSSTFCPSCKKELIKREGYFVTLNNMDDKGNCKFCGEKIIFN